MASTLSFAAQDGGMHRPADMADGRSVSETAPAPAPASAWPEVAGRNGSDPRVPLLLFWKSGRATGCTVRGRTVGLTGSRTRGGGRERTRRESGRFTFCCVVGQPGRLVRRRISGGEMGMSRACGLSTDAVKGSTRLAGGSGSVRARVGVGVSVCQLSVCLILLILW